MESKKIQKLVGNSLMAKIVVIIATNLNFFVCLKTGGKVQSLNPSAQCSSFPYSFPANLLTALSYPYSSNNSWIF
ncbi:hypothetical protein ACRRTK_000407 [Alexandromys fortis]